MTEIPGEGLLSEIAGDAEGVVETGLHAAEGVYDAATGNWNGAADSAMSTTEGALGVATGGIFTAAEAGWDAVAHETGLPTAHEALNTGAQVVGGALGDGLHSLVGDEEALKSVNAFDSGDILGGLGHMAEGAAQTIGGALEHGVSELGSAVGDLFGGSSGHDAAAGVSVAETPAAAVDDPSAGYDAAPDAGY